MKYVSEKSHLPEKEHIAVLLFESYYVPGDERSQTNPGHGYPAHYESRMQYIVMDSEEDLAKWIQSNSNKNYRVVKSMPKTVQTSVSVRLI